MAKPPQTNKDPNPTEGRYVCWINYDRHGASDNYHLIEIDGRYTWRIGEVEDTVRTAARHMTGLMDDKIKCDGQRVWIMDDFGDDVLLCTTETAGMIYSGSGKQASRPHYIITTKQPLTTRAAGATDRTAADLDGLE